MADIQKTVQIVFGGKNEVSKVVDEIGAKFGQLNEMASAVATPLAGVAAAVLKADAALVSLAIGGLAYAIKTAGEFNGKFGEITTLIKETGAPIDQFKNKILEYSTGSVKSIDQINQAIYNAVSAGVSWQDSIKFVNEAEKLSVAGRSGLAETTKVLISTLNAYGASTKEAGKYSDLMFTTVRLGQTTMEELGQSLAMVTGLASTAGIPFSTLSAAIAALTVSGLPTSQAITGIRQALQNIIKPSGEAEQMASRLGIQFNATALKTKGFEGVLNDTYTATRGNISKMGELFGSVESLNTVMILGADKTGKFKEALFEMGKSAGATQVAYDKVAQEFENVNQRLVNNFKVTLIDIGEKLMPKYGEIAGALGALLKGIKIGIDSGAFDPLFAVLDAAGASIATKAKEIAAAFPEALKMIDFKGLASALQDVGEAIGGFLNVDLSNPKDLAATIQRVIDSIKSLVDVSKGIAEPFAPFLDGVKALIDGFNSLDSGTKTMIGNVMGLSLQYKLFGPVVTAVMLAIGSDTESAAKNITVAFAAIDNGINTLKVGVIALGLGFANAFLGMAELLDKVPGFDATEDIARNTERVALLGEALDKAEQDMISSTAKLKDSWNAVTPPIDAAAAAQEAWNRKISDSKTVYVQHGDTLESLTAKLKVMTSSTDGATTGADKLKNAIVQLPDLKEIGIKVLADGTTIERAYGAIIERFPDGQILLTNVGVEADAAKLKAVQKKIDDAIPKDKLVEIQAKLDEAKIKEQSNIIQRSIEWKAKIDIAQVEAETAKLKTMFDSINVSITSTGTALVGMMGPLVSSIGTGTTSFIQGQIEAEARRRDEALLLQKKLIEAEVDVLKKRAEALGKGEGIVKIESSNLAPHLEAFMYEILKAIQVKANSEGMKFLVGV